jgi:hypothetical protein
MEVAVATTGVTTGVAMAEAVVTQAAAAPGVVAIGVRGPVAGKTAAMEPVPPPRVTASMPAAPVAAAAAGIPGVATITAVRKVRRLVVG